MDREITKHYTNGEVTIVWKPSLCIHSTVCWRKNTGLPEVFNPLEKPWVKPEGASTEKIVEQVKRCPSGALSYHHNDAPSGQTSSAAEVRIEAVPKGPLLVYGDVNVKDTKGNEIKKNNITAFCRCGQSASKPFCDGSHAVYNFQT